MDQLRRAGRAGPTAIGFGAILGPAGVVPAGRTARWRRSRSPCRDSFVIEDLPASGISLGSWRLSASAYSRQSSGHLFSNRSVARRGHRNRSTLRTSRARGQQSVAHRAKINRARPAGPSSTMRCARFAASTSTTSFACGSIAARGGRWCRPRSCSRSLAFVENREAASGHEHEIDRTRFKSKPSNRSNRSARRWKSCASRPRSKDCRRPTDLFKQIEQGTKDLPRKQDVDRTKAAVKLNDLAKQLEERREQLGGKDRTARSNFRT